MIVWENVNIKIFYENGWRIHYKFLGTVEPKTRKQVAYALAYECDMYNVRRQSPFNYKHTQNMINSWWGKQ